MERSFSYERIDGSELLSDGVVRHVPGVGFEVEAWRGEVSVICHLAFMQSGRVDAVLIRHAVDDVLSVQQVSRHPKQDLGMWNFDLAKQAANFLLSEHCSEKSIASATVAIQEVVERGEGEEMKRKPGDMVKYGGWVCQVLRRI